MTHNQRAKRRRDIAEQVVIHHRPVGEVAGDYEVSMTMVRQSIQEYFPDEAESLPKGPVRASKTIRIAAQLLRTTDSITEISNRVGVPYQRVQAVRTELLSENVPIPERK